MNQPTRRVFFFLVALVAILAASTSFFAAKTFKMGAGQNSPGATPSSGIDSSTDVARSSQPAATASSAVSKPASSSEKPSKPSDTYTIQKGETLFAIAQAQGLNWQDIADANGIADTDKIQAGQTLILPKGGQVSFTIDNTRATSLQKDADSGKYEFRLDPVETARSDAPSVYGLEVGDTFTLKTNDSGKAQVQATCESKNYTIELSQPVTQGEKGIWAIGSIRPVK